MIIAGIILAGGRSTRMGGGDKPLLDLGGRPLLEHVIERFQPQVARLAINANGDPTRLAPFALPVIVDSVPDFAGPLAGILAGMDWAATQDLTAIVATPGDTPFLPTDLVARLAKAGGEYGVALAASDGHRHPAVGLWPVALREDLRRFLHEGGRRVTAFVEAHGGREVDFAPVTINGRVVDAFTNINTPDDLAAAEAMLAGAAA